MVINSNQDTINETKNLIQDLENKRSNLEKKFNYAPKNRKEIYLNQINSLNTQSIYPAKKKLRTALLSEIDNKNEHIKELEKKNSSGENSSKKTINKLKKELDSIKIEEKTLLIEEETTRLTSLKNKKNQLQEENHYSKRDIATGRIEKIIDITTQDIEGLRKELVFMKYPTINKTLEKTREWSLIRWIKNLVSFGNKKEFIFSKENPEIRYYEKGSALSELYLDKNDNLLNKLFKLKKEDPQIFEKLKNASNEEDLTDFKNQIENILGDSYDQKNISNYKEIVQNLDEFTLNTEPNNPTSAEELTSNEAQTADDESTPKIAYELMNDDNNNYTP